MSGFAARRRRASRDGGRLRDPGDHEGHLRVGAADERLDTLLEEARATSMPPAVKRVGGAPAAVEGRRSSAAAVRADGGRQTYAPERHDRGNPLRCCKGPLDKPRKDRCRWDLRLLRDFLDPYFMAAIRDTLALMIQDNLEGKGLGSRRHLRARRLSFQFRRERTGVA